MSKIYYEEISLFDSPKGSVLVHACNAQGVWGSGIAKEFKVLFPKSFEEYNNYCVFMSNNDGFAPGTALICEEENKYKIGCLITSEHYSSKVDTPDQILLYTKTALEDLTFEGMPSIFYSNKFNSGLFNVPWEKTEQLVQAFIDKYNIDWVVCTPKTEK